MMGRLKHEQEQLFYEFRLDEVIPGDHLVREIAAVLDLTCKAEQSGHLIRPRMCESATYIPDMSCEDSKRVIVSVGPLCIRVRCHSSNATRGAATC
jgi:hypothetical protein